MEKNEVDLMTSAYGLLYEIETNLRKGIDYILTYSYGEGWEFTLRLNREFQNLYFHDLISLFGKYKPLKKVFNTKQKNDLYQLVGIRNKIAHMRVISIQEYNMLKNCNEFVLFNIDLNTSFTT